MVVENVTSIAVNLTDLLGEPVMRSLDFFIKVGIGASIAIIVYVIYLIVKGIFRARTAGHVKQILGELKEMNKKLDVLVFSKQKKKRK